MTNLDQAVLLNFEVELIENTHHKKSLPLQLDIYIHTLHKYTGILTVIFFEVCMYVERHVLVDMYE